jgi:dihydropteroate synthase
MGIVNVTPDSFSDGGNFLDPQKAIGQGLRLAEAGADLVDVGGESTRPGAAGVAADEELRRVLPVVAGLAGEGLAVSIDTAKAEVAAQAIEAGAEVVNDVTAFGDPEMSGLVSASQAGVVLMHMRGTPRTMQADPRYDDVVAEVCDFLVERAAAAERAGVERDRIAIDPGLGFGKTVDHNLRLLSELSTLAGTGYPVMVGTSRKSFLGRLTGIEDPALRDLATAVSVALAAERGASIFRVHDVASSREALAVLTAIVGGSGTKA